MDLRCSADPAAGGACGQRRVHGGRHSMHGATTQDAVGLAVKVESRAAGMRGATIEGARGAAGLAVKVKTMLGIGTRASTEYRSGLQNGNVVQQGNEVADGSASMNLSKKSTAKFSNFKRQQ